MLTVTHRLASVTDGDRIFVLEQGEVVEQGTHEELLARGGVYTELWDKQSGFSFVRDGRRRASRRTACARSSSCRASTGPARGH